MKKYLLSIIFITSLLISNLFAQAEITSRLSDALAEASKENSTVRTLVMLKDQVDINKLDKQLYETKATLEERAYIVITTLQEKANTTQSALIEYLDNKYTDEVAEYRSFWITNMVFVEAVPSVILEIAERNDIANLDLDAELVWDKPVSAEPAASKSPNGHEIGLERINAHLMWAAGFTGAGRIVMNDDTGVDVNHPALGYKWRGNNGAAASASWFDPGGSTLPYDADLNSPYHGTHTMGTMCGLDPATNDTIGVAPGAQWIASRGFYYASGSIGAWQWAVDPDGNPNTIDDMPDAINNSWRDPSVTNDCDPALNPYYNPYIAVEASGIAIIFSAGNSGPSAQSITPPHNTNIDLVSFWATGALDGNNPSLPIASFSSRGPVTAACSTGVSSLDIKPEASAPGVSVRSSMSPNGYQTMSGTSMAAPHVTGAIALLREAHPGITGWEAKMALYQTASDLGDPGEDNTYGMGIIDVYAAHLSLADPDDPNPPTGFTAYSDYATPTSMLLNWTDPSAYFNGNPLTNFQIYVYRDGSMVGAAAMGAETYTDNGLTDGQAYAYSIVAADIPNDSLSSEVSAGWTAGGAAIPSAPENLVAVSDTEQVVLTWTDPTTQVDGTLLDDLDHLNIYRDGSILTTVAPGVETYTDMPTAGLAYNYSVTAVDNETTPNESDPSNTVRAFVGHTQGLVLIIDDDVTLSMKVEDAQKGSYLRTEGTEGLAADNMARWLEESAYVVEVVNVATSLTMNWDGYDVVINSSGGNTSPVADAAYRTMWETFAADPAHKYIIEGGEVGYDVASSPGYPAWETGVIYSDTWAGDISGDMPLRSAYSSHPIANYPNILPQSLTLNSPGFGDQDSQNNLAGSYVVYGTTDEPDNAGILVYDDNTVPVSAQMAFFAFNFGVLADTNDAKGLIENTVGFLLAEETLNNDPIMTVNPQSFEDTLLVGASATHYSFVTNSQNLGSTLNYTVTESPVVSWLDVTPVSGSLLSLDSDSLALAIDATGLTAGSYSVEIIIAGDDPANAEDTIEVSLEVNDAPVVGANPDSLAFSLFSNTVDSMTLSITNSGSGPLYFTLEDEDVTERVRKQREVDLSYIKPSYQVEIAKDAVDWRQGTAQSEGMGGPDLFGYTWKDSDEPGGPSFNWIDISITGTNVPCNSASTANQDGALADDDFEGPFPIGFTFNYYGNQYTEFYIQSNGMINFVAEELSLTNAQIPVADANNNMIAWCWDDMDPGNAATEVFYETVGNNLIIQFVNYYEYPDGGAAVDAEVILSPNGKVVVQYDHFDSGFDLVGSTVGIENADGSDGLQVAYNGAYLHDQLALVYALDSDWLSSNPTSGTVAPGGSADVQVRANTDQMFGGDYLANIVIESNDPVDPEFRVPVSLHVVGVADIGVSTTMMDWGTIFTNVNDTMSLGITNTGTDTLHVTSIANYTSEYTIVGLTAFSLLIGETHDLPVIFSSATPGTFDDSLVIVSNAVNPAPTVDMTGIAVDPPIVGVDPLAITDSLLSGQSSVHYFDVFNDGASPLYFDISIDDNSKRAVTVKVLRNNTSTATLNYPKGTAAASIGKAPVKPAGAVNNPQSTFKFGETAFGLDALSDTFLKLNLASPSTPVTISTIAMDLYAGDFAPTGEFYAIDNVTSSLVQVDTSTGVATTVGALTVTTGHTWTGLAYDPSTASWFGLSVDGTAMSLYAIDIATPLATVIGGQSTTPLAIDLAFDNAGICYTHDLSDNIYLLDVTNAAATLIGATGFDANYAQGMDVDPLTNTLYLAAYNGATSSAELRSVEVSTGMTTLLGSIGAGAGVEVGAFGIAGAGSPDWISTNPVADTVAVGDTVQVAVAFNSTGLIDGWYNADVNVNSNDPVTSTVTVDASLHVTGVANIAVDPMILDYGFLFLGTSDTMTFAVQNPGTADLNVSGLATSTADFTVLTGTPFTVTPGSSQDVDVVYSAVASGTHSDSVVVAHDAPIVVSGVVQLTGETSNPPVIALSDTLLHHQMNEGEEDSTALMMYNNGASLLEYELVLGDVPFTENDLAIVNLTRDPSVTYSTSADANSNSTSHVKSGGYSEALFDLQFNFDATAASGAAGNAGAEFDGTYYYSTRWASNLIHQYDMAGNLVQEFSIAGVTGLRDLAFDGTYFYGGASATTIYIMDFVSQTLVGTIPSPEGVRHIAYDAGMDAFWIGNWATDLYLVDRNGATLSTIPAATHGMANMYGSAYDDYSPGGPYLWVFDQNGATTTTQTPQLLIQLSLPAGTPTGVQYDILNDFVPGTDVTLAGGLFITEGIVSGKATLGGLAQGVPDVIFCYELAEAASWVTLGHTEGTIAPGDSGSVWVYWHGIITEQVFDGYLGVYSNDPVNPVENVHLSLEVIMTGIGDGAEALPTKYALHQNFPNPFNPSTTIKYDLKAKTDVKLTIYNVLGQKVRTLVQTNQAAGFKNVVWNGLNEIGEQVATGVYIYRIEADGFVKSRKMVFMK
jgi:subtilase family protein/flagellar hook capping protein FlgD/HYDIN/CFA65/VesB family protein/BACON domain-containing protein